MNFDLAPPPKTIGAITAVPIDIDHIDASLHFDAATSSGTGDATLTFTLGSAAGSPIFDLRQPVTALELDGVPVDPALFAHHDFSPVPNPLGKLRVLEMPLAAGSTHILHVTYTIGTPLDTQFSFTPAWSAGPRLIFRFHFSDLNAGRYLEQWIPANLIFDQFSLDLDLQIVNTAIPHTLLTNGAASPMGANHWSVAFPERYTAVSHFLELRPTDTLASHMTSVMLPVSGKSVSIELWKLAASAAIDLAVTSAKIASWLVENETDYGPYLHSRFVAMINTGGMEYEGATTCENDDIKLRHETFHSWFSRGVKPALQNDGWIDEGWAVYHDGGASSAVPFDFAAAPVELSPRNDPWIRTTPLAAYDAGELLFAGIAALASPADLRSWMADLYRDYRDRPATTGDLEALLLARSGDTDVVRAFDRFVYGFGDAAKAPSLWLRDEAGDPGDDDSSSLSTFWHSPDLWIRHKPDGVPVHQPPAPGQDNYFHARIRNHATGGPARHFAITFTAKSFAGLEFVYPSDFLPAIAAAVGFDLAPGASRIVSARWAAALVPPEKTKICLLAAAMTPGDFPVAGRHVWEHNNLAQKNIVIGSAGSGEFYAFMFVTRGGFGDLIDRAFLSLRASPDVRAALLVPAKDRRPRRFTGPELKYPSIPGTSWSSRDDASIAARLFENAEEIALPPEKHGPGLPLPLAANMQRVLALKIWVPDDARPGDCIEAHLVKRTARGAVTGGIAVRIDVT